MRPTPTRWPWRGRAVVALIAAAAAAAAVVAGPGALPAHAEPRVTITNERGQAQADLTYSTPVTVSGSGFQSIAKGFGGIYVLFGTVQGTWRPSQGGTSGTDFLYVPDQETKDNQGFQRFVSFPGSETEYAANGGELAADGTWSLTMTIPGPRFEATAADGSTRTVDCTTTTCGIITIGAHGQVNANNETFTPVSFCDMQAAPGSAGACAAADDGGASGAAPGQGSAGAGAQDSTDTAADDAAGAADTAGAVDTGTATVGIDQSTAVVGRVLGFTGQGFTPGEQVVGSLGGGLAAIGPLVAGAQGEVAGVLQLPADLRPGTQTFKLTGAGSGRVAELEFQVIQDPAVAAAQANAARDEPTRTSPWIIVVGAVGLLVLGLIIASARAAGARRKAARTAAAGVGSVVPAGPALPPAPGVQGVAASGAGGAGASAVAAPGAMGPVPGAGTVATAVPSAAPVSSAPVPAAPASPAPVPAASGASGVPARRSVSADDDRPTQTLPPQPAPAFPSAEAGR